MFRVNSNLRPYFVRSARNRLTYGQVGSVAIDQTLGQDFNINPDTGLPDYYMTRLIRESNSSGFEQAFAALNEFRSDGLPADMSNEDALSYIKPRSVQTPAEVLAWRSRLAAIKQEQKDAASAKEAAKKQQEADEELFNAIVSQTGVKEPAK